jgi:hypothetical protein
MKAAMLAILLLALAACRPEKDPSTGGTDGPLATGPSRDAACDKLLRNDKGEYSAGKCVCSETSPGLWRCSLGN